VSTVTGQDGGPGDIAVVTSGGTMLGLRIVRVE